MSTCKRLLLILAVVALAGPATRGGGLEEIPEPGHPAFTPGEIIVKLRPASSPEPDRLSRVLRESGIDADESIPVFAAFNPGATDPRREAEILRRTLARLRSASPGRTLPERVEPRGLGDVYRVIVSDESADVVALSRRLAGHPSVAYAEPNFVVKASLQPDDPYYHSSGTWGQSYDDLWGLKKIQCEGAWDETTGSPAVVVAVVDTGIDYNHPDLLWNVWWNSGEVPDNGVDDDSNGYIDDFLGYDFCTYGGKPRDADPMDDRGHGTHCAGTIAAVTDNTLGVAAISWSSKVMALKGLDHTGYGWVSDLAEAIVYAADNGAAVISNSWGGEDWYAPQVLQDAVDHAYDLGCVIVAAAGNSSADALKFSPANMKEVVTVSAFDESDTKASFSNWGIKIDVGAPGVDVLSCLAAGSEYEQNLPQLIVGEKYIRLDGTSMAAPHVSGLAALILSANPSFTNEEVRQVLRVSADDVGPAGWDTDSGYGRINASQALQVDSVLTAAITSPAHRDYMEGTVDVLGTASGPDFVSYRVEYGAGLTPSVWNLIAESTTEVVDGLLATWDATTLDDGEYTLRLDAVDASGRHFGARVLVWRDAAIKAGWPVGLTGPVYSNVALVEMGGDPGIEAVVGTPVGSGEDAHGQYHVLTQAGDSAEPGWPQDTESPVANSAAVGDVDLDGYPEVVGTCMGYRRLYAWNKDGDPLSPAFPVDISRSTYVFKWGGYIQDLTPVLADLDDDPDLEIVIDSVGIVYAINPDGSSVPGWPVTLMTLENLKAIKDAPAVAVGDLDRDGLPEIVTWQSYQESDYPYNWITDVYVLNHDGTLLETGSWPIHTTEVSVASAPTLGDIDADGDLEVLLGGLAPDKGSIGFVHAWHHDGTPVDNWPVNVGYTVQTDPVLADLDNDGHPEVLVTSTTHTLYAFRWDGSKMLEIPATFGGNPHPTVGDVDGDGEVEILAGGYYGDLYGWNTDGTVIDGWPRKTRDLISTSSAIGDLDQDGDVEVVVGSKDRRLYAWDFDFPFDPTKVEWSMFRGTPLRTGRYVPPAGPCSAPPPEVSTVTLSKATNTRVEWDGLGPGLLYDVAGGFVGDLRIDGGVDGAACLVNDVPDELWGDLRPDPGTGEGYYYMVRASNRCGRGSYGSSTIGPERTPDTDCP